MILPGQTLEVWATVHSENNPLQVSGCCSGVEGIFTASVSLSQAQTCSEKAENSEILKQVCTGLT